ncbi:hypothetical protein CEXT_256801 [Caerostris extrusa]|uniref:Uncharacterized protein n=1 Tax=Caerostris extrusa TaxID=172846 RepID=A0AAV4MNQ8_CAEEX|nr:hypothetical protein CEXT_256801 [Caerostris extrusa]
MPGYQTTMGKANEIKNLRSRSKKSLTRPLKCMGELSQNGKRRQPDGQRPPVSNLLVKADINRKKRIKTVKTERKGGLFFKKEVTCIPYSVFEFH